MRLKLNISGCYYSLEIIKNCEAYTYTYNVYTFKLLPTPHTLQARTGNAYNAYVNVSFLSLARHLMRGGGKVVVFSCLL